MKKIIYNKYLLHACVKKKEFATYYLSLLPKIT